MAVNGRAGKESAEPPDKSAQRLALDRGARVFRRSAVGRYPSDITDSDRVGIVAQTMGTLFLEGTTGLDRSVEEYQKMLTDAVEAPLTVPRVDILHCVRPPFGRRRAMHDNLIYLSHNATKLPPGLPPRRLFWSLLRMSERFRIFADRKHLKRIVKYLLKLETTKFKQ